MQRQASFIQQDCHAVLQKLSFLLNRTAIHLAARAGNVDVLKALVEEQSADQVENLVNQTDNFGITPVFLALQK